ncbi:hypothetical protein [Virgibacillus sp. MG-45]|uniref:hypothetical protein n=1 Tax=Virgibacillus sp. MG-45 TaxID=3102791 RepID=UPI002ED9091F
MTHEELQGFEVRFNDIKKAPEQIRDKRLVILMEDMECAYNIPLVRNEVYEHNNPEVMNLYRKVSMARSF